MSTGAADGGAGHLPHIQGLRGIAVLLVVVFHAGLPLEGGFVGVDVFFVISGYVITRLLVRDGEARGGVRFRHFYARRIRRLLPALSVLLVCTVVVSAVLQSPLGAQQGTALVGVGASAWLANIALMVFTGGYFETPAGTIPFLHTWSLAVEEQFYLVFPAALGVGFWLGRRFLRSDPVRGALVVLGGVLVVSLPLCVALSYGGGLGLSRPGAIAFYSAPTRAWEFAVGGLVALAALRRRALPPAAAQVVGGAGLVAVVASAALISEEHVWPGLAVLVPVLGTAVVLFAALTPGTATGSLLESAPLRRAGDLSYSWYLWHWPLVVFAALLFPESTLATVVAAAVSYPIAALSYRFVEEPIRRRPIDGGRALRMAAVCVAVPVVASAALYVGSEAQWGDEELSAMADQVMPLPIGAERGCHTDLPLGDRDLSECTFGGDRPGRPVFLIGDSNALQFSDGLVVAGEELDRPVVVGTMSACPLVDLVIRQPGVDWDACREFVVDTTEWLEQQPEAVVVLSSANAFMSTEAVTFRSPDGTDRARKRAEKAEIWEAAQTRTLERLRRAGHQVLLIETIPHLIPEGDYERFWSPAKCTLPELLADTDRCDVVVQRAAIDEEQAHALSADEASARAAGVPVLSFRDELCGPTRCSAHHGDRWTYRDGMHISVQESERLADRLAGAIIALGAAG